MGKRRHWEDDVEGSDKDTTWTTGESELDSRKYLQHNLLYNGHRMSFPIGLSRPEPKPTTHLHAIPGIGMGGVVPSLPPYVLKSITNDAEGDLCLSVLHATATRLGIRHPANVNKIKQQWCSEVSKQETLYNKQGEHKVFP
jgi:hypothetical protein